MMKKNKILSKQVMWLVVTEVQSESFRLVTEHCHYNAHYVTLYYVSAVIFLNRRVWYRTLSLHYACI